MTQFSTRWWRRALATLPFLVPALAGAGGGIAPAIVHPNCQTLIAAREHFVFPRRLKLAREVVELALETPRDARLLRALSKVFTELTPERMALLGHALRGRPGRAWQILVPHELNPFFHAHPELVDQSVLENYTILFREFIGSNLEPFDVGLLAALLKGHPRTAFRERAVERDWTARPADTLARLRALIERPAYRGVLAHLTENPSLLGILRQEMIDSGRFGPADLAAVEPRYQQIAKQVRQRSIDRFEAFEILKLIRALTGCIERFALDSGTYDFVFSREGILRDGYLILARQYLEACELGFPAAILVDLLDNVYFETPLPVESEAVYRAVLESALRLVLPMKNAYLNGQAARARLAVRTRLAPGPGIELNLIDFHPPAPESKRARRPRPGGVTAPEAAPPAPIDYATPLAPYTSYAEAPADGELDVTKIYDFHFLRDGTREHQRVRFGPDALGFFKTNSRLAKAFLNALYMGGIGGAGGSIRELTAEQRRRPERVYRLKTAGSFRGLMFLDDHVWQLVTIVHKDEVDRVARHLRPL